MGTTMNRAAFERMIAEDREWLAKQPQTLERSHIDLILHQCAEHYYSSAETRIGALRAECERLTVVAKGATDLAIEYTQAIATLRAKLASYTGRY